MLPDVLTCISAPEQVDYSTVHIAHPSCNPAKWWTDWIVDDDDDAAGGNAAAWGARSRPHDY